MVCQTAQALLGSIWMAKKEKKKRLQQLARLTGIRNISHTSPRPSDTHYPGQFVITLKLDEYWGLCYPAHDGGFVKTAV